MTSPAKQRLIEAIEQLHARTLIEFGPVVAADIAVILEDVRRAGDDVDATAHGFAMAAVNARIQRAIAERGK
ncbi:MAG: hypothetical protein M9918_21385 [Anaerolineae bacterium]|nr:hypothetical protein [Anaerolineae bacterium]MCO5195559.1 hypothetical protein [Anaerolineae bacterium]